MSSLFDPAGAVGTAASPAPAAVTAVLAHVRVVGLPKPQGSKVPFLDPRSGHARLKEQNATTHRSWREDVTIGAERARELLDAPLDGPLALEVTFRFPMPKARPKAVRLAGWCFKETAPDTSKLVRSIEDSMEAAGLIVNDARFAKVDATKIEVLDGWTGADITIRRAMR